LSLDLACLYCLPSSVSRLLSSFYQLRPFNFSFRFSVSRLSLLSLFSRLLFNYPFSCLLIVSYLSSLAFLFSSPASPFSYILTVSYLLSLISCFSFLVSSLSHLFSLAYRLVSQLFFTSHLLGRSDFEQKLSRKLYCALTEVSNCVLQSIYWINCELKAFTIKHNSALSNTVKLLVNESDSNLCFLKLIILKIIL
jgi:hypothetical protein